MPVLISTVPGSVWFGSVRNRSDFDASGSVNRKRVYGSVQFGSGRFTLVACAVKITFGSLRFNMASVYIINFENKLRTKPNRERSKSRL